MDKLKTALATAVLCTAAHGEIFEANRWGFGPLAGINLPEPNLGGPEDQGILGWAVGGRLELEMNRLFSLATDPMFTRSGAEFDPSGTQFEARGQFYMVELPLLFKARTQVADWVGLYGFLGPSASFLWDASGQLEAGQHLDSQETAWGEFSGDIGLGSAFSVAPRVDVTADARYSYGFTDLLEHGVGEIDEWRSRDVRFILGVILHGG